MDIEILKNNVFSYVGNVITGEMILTILKKAISYVPKVNQIYPAHNIAIPAIQGIALNSDNEVLQNMFYAQLIKAIDKTKQDQCHPSFPKILGELSFEELRLLYFIFHCQDISFKIIEDGTPELTDSVLSHKFPNFNMYFVIFMLKNIATYRKSAEGSFDGIRLTSFGEKFLKACLNKETESLIQEIVNEI